MPHRVRELSSRQGRTLRRRELKQLARRPQARAAMEEQGRRPGTAPLRAGRGSLSRAERPRTPSTKKHAPHRGTHSCGCTPTSQGARLGLLSQHFAAVARRSPLRPMPRPLRTLGGDRSPAQAAGSDPAREAKASRQRPQAALGKSSSSGEHTRTAAHVRRKEMRGHLSWRY